MRTSRIIAVAEDAADCTRAVNRRPCLKALAVLCESDMEFRVAGRERDWQFARDALAAGIVDAGTLAARVGDLPISAEHQRAIGRSLARIRG